MARKRRKEGQVGDVRKKKKWKENERTRDLSHNKMHKMIHLSMNLMILYLYSSVVTQLVRTEENYKL